MTETQKHGWTKADHDALQSAVAANQLALTCKGPPAKTIEFRSFAQMLRILSAIRKELQIGVQQRPFRFEIVGESIGEKPEVVGVAETFIEARAALRRAVRRGSFSRHWIADRMFVAKAYDLAGQL